MAAVLRLANEGCRVEAGEVGEEVGVACNKTAAVSIDSGIM